MRISFNWLKDYVAAGIPPAKLAHRLTMAGLEVERIDEAGGEAVFEMEITPNRPDCLSILGIAREVSAILNRPLRVPRPRKLRMPQRKVDITIEDKKGCLRYIGAIIGQVEVSESPADMQKKLGAVGIRAINNIVDITNFCLMELGQPMHAFDYDKLKGGKIIVRRAKKGEKLVTIDGVERELDPSILVIADAARPVAIAGIMGGLDTEVTEKTKTVLLESAYFDPILIRRASRALGLASDSSYRFERGVDLPTVETAILRATSLIKDLAQGVLIGRKDVGSTTPKTAIADIAINAGAINDLLGADLSAARCKTILKKLGFHVSTRGSRWMVRVPSFRSDIKREVDLIEEISRVVGYDNLPSSLPTVMVANIPSEPVRDIKNGLRRQALALGFNEIITYTMINRKSLAHMGLDSGAGIEVLNPLSQDQELLRPSLLPGFLGVVRSNVNRGSRNLRFFEIGKIYSAQGEQDVLGLLMTGTCKEDWRQQQLGVGFFDLKGAIASLCERHRLSGIEYEHTDDVIFAPGQAASIKKGKKAVGLIGKINDALVREWDIKQRDVYFAQLSAEPFFAEQAARRFKPMSDYPSISRDISIAVGKDVSFKDVEAVVRSHGTVELAAVRFLEEYLGDKIPEGQKGLVFSLSFQSLSRTLTEEEINKVHESICRALTENLGAVLR